MRFIRYLVINGVFAACLWFGLHEGIEGAANIAMIMAWMAIVLSFFASHPNTVEAWRKCGRTMPLWFDQLFDVVIILFMAWHGWVVTAVGMVVHMVLVAAAHEKAFGKKAETQESKP